jgi:outer membrane lipoprotein LolB
MWLRLIPALLLAGCSALPVEQKSAEQNPVEPVAYRVHLEHLATIENFGLEGRIGVLTETKGFSGSMRWHHRNDGDTIAFYSPLGTQLGELEADANGVTLTTSQKTYRAADAETLTQQTLGWSLPLRGLPDWALGRPTKGDAEILAWDAAGRISKLRQQGWDIEYPAYQNQGFELPTKIVLKSRKLDLKLVVENWRVESE